VRRSIPILLCALVAGCGGGGVDRRPEPPEARGVRAMMDDYFRAMVAHDWPRVCSIYTPGHAARQTFAGTSGCADALRRAARGPSNVPGVHPERANEHLSRARVVSVVIHDATHALVNVDSSSTGEADTSLHAVRIAGAWRLDQGLGLTIPLDLSPARRAAGES
jgi:hypothetical protein